MAYSKTNYVDGVTPLNAKNFNNNESALDQVVKDVTSISQALVQVDDKVEGKADVVHSHSELHSHSNKTVLDGVTSAKVTEWNNKSTFDGNYNSLTNKPTIPTVDVTKNYVDTELTKKSNTGHRHNASEIDGLGSGGDVDLTGYATETFVMDKLGGKRHVYLTQAEYDALGEAEKNDDTIVYGITDAQDKDVTDLKLTGSKLDLVNKDGVVIGNGVTLPASTGGSSVTVENVLTSTSTTNALAAAQGKVLDDKITVLNAKVDGLELGGNLVIRDVEDGEIFEIDTTVPTVSVTSVSLNKSTTTVPKGSNETLVATVSPSNASNKTVTWSSSNTSIATVNNGVVTGVTDGNCVITATTVDGGFTATCNVTVETVTIPVTGVSLDKTTHTFKVDETIQLTATVIPSNATNKNVTWTSSDTNKATVVDGLVTAKAEGSATITVATVDGNKTATCNLTIREDNITPPFDNTCIVKNIGNSSSNNYYSIYYNSYSNGVLVLTEVFNIEPMKSILDKTSIDNFNSDGFTNILNPTTSSILAHEENVLGVVLNKANLEIIYKVNIGEGHNITDKTTMIEYLKNNPIKVSMKLLPTSVVESKCAMELGSWKKQFPAEIYVTDSEIKSVDCYIDFVYGTKYIFIFNKDVDLKRMNIFRYDEVPSQYLGMDSLGCMGNKVVYTPKNVNGEKIAINILSMTDTELEFDIFCI